MQQNPFTSETYKAIWLKHFNRSKPSYNFNFINNVGFIKHKTLPYYVNIGKNLTSGMDYSLNYEASDYKGKTFLVYDVPSYFNLPPFKEDQNQGLGLKRVFQYPGFLMDFTVADTDENYIKTRFVSQQSRKFRSSQRRLETCFNVRYEFITGDMDFESFKVIFDQYNALLTKRFSEKQLNLHFLRQTERDFYEELVYEMIKLRKATWMVVYNDQTPIGILLLFQAKDGVFDYLRVFDPDYYKFSIGKVCNLKLVEWCYENHYKLSDFSKGDFEHKRKWSNVTYDFHYHIFYDKNSLKSRMIANALERFFKAKLYLREKDYNTRYRKLLFNLKGGYFSKKEQFNTYDTQKLDAFPNDRNFIKLDLKNDPNNQYENLLEPFYSFLYINSEHENDVEVFQDKLQRNDVIFKGKKAIQKTVFS